MPSRCFFFFLKSSRVTPCSHNFWITLGETCILKLQENQFLRWPYRHWRKLLSHSSHNCICDSTPHTQLLCPASVISTCTVHFRLLLDAQFLLHCWGRPFETGVKTLAFKYAWMTQQHFKIIVFPLHGNARLPDSLSVGKTERVSDMQTKASVLLVCRRSAADSCCWTFRTLLE